MPPTALLARLERALPLLAGGPQDLPERQRTMRDALTWSYNLLGTGEETLFRRLAGFAGRWNLEAAESICTGGPVTTEGVLHLVQALVQQSLVVAEEGATGQGRYRMLEPVRQYARELLDATAEGAECDRRHVAYYLALAEQAEEAIRGRRRDQVAWLDRLDEDNDNIRVAMDRALGRGDFEVTERFGWGLCMFWVMRSRSREGRHWIERLLEQGVTLEGLPRARALYVLAVCLYGSGEDARIVGICDESISLSRAVGDTLVESYALGMAGYAHLNLGDLDREEAVMQESLALCRARCDVWGQSHILSHLAVVPLRRGEYAHAAACAEASLSGTRETGDQLATSVALLVLAQAAQGGGDNERAAAYFEDGLRLAAAAFDRANACYCLEGLAALALARGDAERGARLLLVALAILETINSPRFAYMPDRGSGERLADRVRDGLGEQAWLAARAEAGAMTFEQAVAFALAEGIARGRPH